MTVESTYEPNVLSYTGPGRYDFTFFIGEDTDLVVTFINTLGVQSIISRNDYTVVKNTAPVIGGYITTSAPADTEGQIELSRAIPYTQPVRWSAEGNLNLDKVEESFDRAVLQIQQALAMIRNAAMQLVWKGAWISLYPYEYLDIVRAANGNWYCCILGHTSGTFADDLADGYWTIVIDTAALLQEARLAMEEVADTMTAIGERSSAIDTDFYEATEGQTEFAITKPTGENNILVFMNTRKLRLGEDYTLNSSVAASLLTLGVGAADGDEIEIYSFNTYSIVGLESSSDVNVKLFGAIGDGVSDDTAAIQSALNHCGYYNKFLYLPSGTYKTTSPLTVNWASNTSLPGIRGEGYGTVLYSTISTAGRAALELLGTSNTVSINTEIKNFRIRMKNGDAGAYCLRVGDAKNGFLAERLWLDGANGVLLKIASSASYAQMCTVFRQVSIISNYNSEWFANDSDATVYALRDESGGASWDNVHLESCFFGGMVRTRATMVQFSNCQFSTNPSRPIGYSYNIFVNIGNLSVDSCYFEDHKVAIFIYPTLANVKFIDIRNSHFSGASNYGGVGDRAIECLEGVGALEVGSLQVHSCEFGDDSYALEAIRHVGEISSSFSGLVNFETITSPVAVATV